MLRDQFIGFEDEVIGTSKVYHSSSEFNERLGRCDSIGAFIVLSDAVAAYPARVCVYLEHSGDGIHWVPKPTNPDTGDNTLVWGDTGNSWEGDYGYDAGGDDGTIPKLQFARLAIQATLPDGMGGFTSARVHVYIAMRDRGAA